MGAIQSSFTVIPTAAWKLWALQAAPGGQCPGCGNYYRDYAVSVGMFYDVEFTGTLRRCGCGAIMLPHLTPEPVQGDFYEVDEQVRSYS